MTQSLLRPQPLSAEHQLGDFSCGESSLDEWLRHRALSNQTSGASRTFVVTSDTGHVMAYDALAAGTVSHQDSPGKIRRNMPDPVPVLVLARLAVDQRFQGQHIGGALLQDALRRAVSVAEQIGVRALMVHALNGSAVKFYTHYGFMPSPANPMTLMLALHPRKNH
ncbi:GNAT family N-acetyltransferase [Lamprobacter modestohalophilus]|uniref:GNAT family N-acetyltransferase n=1 Tax=Lamprobacter modestohalophilus TaxID=1064514 RepID=UPI002ADEEE46|nr:GNAT family N-acetyltransferase [Lamprobacter modestohalophilus]MEA1053412.1 GNAT family N-acetyltransferase [Lamprobacter modestohalophilus]